jgi:membrane associated rhomboid family serine protease
MVMPLPVGDQDVRGALTPWVLIVLLVLNVLVFAAEALMPQEALEEFVLRWGAVPAELSAGRRLETAITSMFLHGGWLHVASNMLFLWIFADNVEAAFGRLGFLVFYLLGGIVAVVAQVLSDPSSTIPSVGASGAVAASLGAYVVMFPAARVRLLLLLGIFPILTTRVAAIVFIGVWALMQVFSGVASLGAPTAQTTGIAYWAHIGGFAFGLVVGLLFRGRASSLTLEQPTAVRRRPPF